MKKFLIFLSIIIVTLLALTDLRQQMAELDEISNSIQTEKQVPDNVGKGTVSAEKRFEMNNENHTNKFRKNK